MPRPRSFSLVLVISILTRVVVHPAHGQPEAEPVARSIGIALGGGAARGLAHIGVLEWLEEHRVPVHYIAGTSMGGLIGGAYATGMSPAAIRRLMREMDWDLVFLADSPFKYKTFRRKEDSRLYPSQIELGLRGGLRFPAGMNSGQEIAFALDRITAPYYAIDSFDQLPTPFRCVAADLRSQKAVVLGAGSLSLAMRATMAIPGAFTPVERGEALLVDGGTLNNVPADVARDMGAQVVIAVNVGAAGGLPPPESLFDVIGQAMDVMMAPAVERALDEADIVITPELRELTGIDFRASDQIADRGYAAAEAMKGKLLPHAVSEEAYDAWRRERGSRKRVLDPSALVESVRVEGLDDDQAARVATRLDAALSNRPYDPEAITREAQRLRGTDRYALVRYQPEDAPGASGTRLVFFVDPKDYGPPFLHPAVDLQNVDADTFALNLRARLVSFDAPLPGAEVRIDGVAGTRLEASGELYWRLFRTPLFLAPRAHVSRQSRNLFGDDDRFLALYRETNAGLGVDVGIDVGSSTELRLGYDVLDVTARPRVGDPSLPVADGTNRFLSLRFTFDTQTSPLIPTRGLFVRARLSHYLNTPSLFLGDAGQPGPKDYQRGELRLSLFHSLPGEHRLFVGASGGSSFREDPGFNDFSLGGLLRLGAFNNGQLRGDNYVLGQAGALVRVLRLPDVLGGNGYAGAWLEVGSAFERWEDRRIDWQVSGGFVLETFIGPMFLGGSLSLSSGDGRLYVSLGPFFR